MKILFLILALCAVGMLVVGAGNRDAATPARGTVAEQVELKEHPPTDPIASTPRTDPGGDHNAVREPTQVYALDWYSVNGGGAIEIASSSYRLGLSVGQPVAGAVSGTSYSLGVGFWYGLEGGGVACPVTMTGDVNVDVVINAADVIYLVNYVFKSGAVPQPCAAAGDVNCDTVINAADVIYMVNYVFKSGTPPCDVCTLIPGSWTCP